MPLVTRTAALHGAYWSFDPWYRLSWYVWPGAMALLISGWIYVEKPGGPASSSTMWGKPAATATPLPIRRSPVLTNWPEKLQDDVMRCFSNAIDLNPLIEACTRLIDSGQANDEQLVNAYSQRGQHQRLNQPDRALDDYNAALKIKADSPGVLTNRAWIYMTRHRYDSAVEDLNRAIELFPPPLAARSRYYRGFSYLRLRDFDRAMSDLNESLRVDPNNPDPYLARGEVEGAQKLYDAALRDFDEYSKRAPRDARGLVGRGSVLEATGRIPEAVAALDRALALDPASALARARRDVLRSQQNAAEPSK